MGSTESTLSQSELYSLFDQVDLNASDTLDLDEVKQLCLLIWTKEGLTSPLPPNLPKTVFELLDLDGDGVITRQEFELLVEEVYNDRKKFADSSDSWLNFFGISAPSLAPENPIDDELAIPLDPEPDPASEAKVVVVKKKRKKFEEISDHSPSEASEVSNSIAEEAPEENEAEEAAAKEEGVGVVGGGWLSGISSFFQSSSPEAQATATKAASVKAEKKDAAVEQESAPFWRHLFEKKEQGVVVVQAPVQETSEAAVRMVPLRQFLLTQPQMSVTERALRSQQRRPVRPWPVDIAPLWQGPVMRW